MRNAVIFAIAVLLISSNAFAAVPMGKAEDVIIRDAGGDYATVTSNALDVNALTQGTVAEDAASSASPIHIGGIAETTVPTAVSDGDAIGLNVNEYGEQRIAGFNPATGAVDVNPVAQEPVGNGYLQIIDSTFNATTKAQTSSAVFVGDKRDVSFLLSAAIDRTGNTVKVDWFWESSPDNSNWISSDVVINSGGTSTITSRDNHTTAADVTVTKSAHFPDRFTTQYVRLKCIGDNNDADDLSVVDAWISWQK